MGNKLSASDSQAYLVIMVRIQVSQKLGLRLAHTPSLALTHHEAHKYLSKALIVPTMVHPYPPRSSAEAKS